MAKTRKTLRSESGQASLMIGMMMMTFILLFAFVVNTGMLVNAKINLQNAADLAAYAGAAVQARQLDDISYLNYEMRRQYKKFLFRYYVIGNMASGYFPRPGNAANNVPQWGPGPGAQPPINYGVPAVCVAFSSTGPLDNYCQVGELVGITIPNSNPLDQINQTLIQQLQGIEQLREQSCGKIATANTTLLMLWLFNTSPDLSSLISGTNDTNLQAVMRVSESAAAGLGLIPREVILRERIKTLQDYVNEPAQAHVTKAAIDSLQQSSDPPSVERTIQAFLSAYYTLGNHSFNDDTQVYMDELLPGDSTAANLVNLLPIEQSFDAYSVQFELAGQVVNGSANCVPYLVPITARNVPLGVSKDPSVMTFYAIRLTATAQVLFSPFGPMTLTAYAAARPFGSRIGPPAGTYTTFTTSSLSPQFQVDPALKNQAVGAIPDLPFSETDLPLAPGKGWDNGQTLAALYNEFFPGGNPAGAGNSSALSTANFDGGIQAAMVPNPIEGTRYNIVPDNSNNDPFITAFDGLHQMSFWAPVISPTKVQNLQSVLQSDIQGIFQQAPTNGIPTAGNSAQNLQTALSSDILNYVNLMEKGQGEILAGQPDASGRCNPGSCVQEGLNIAHIQDPWVQADGTPIQLSNTIMIQPGDTTAYKTSYVTTLDPAFQAAGRVGYSVKFISFESLLKGTDTTGSGTVYTFQPPDTQAQQDLKQIQH